jgi:predicted AlkP superfamily pyrophosphatase or phosphodiesterase
VGEHPIVPDYAGACVSNLVPAILESDGRVPSWLPEGVAAADQVVLLLLDGLGWEQLLARPEVAPTLAGLVGGPILTVAPSTTATALTSISTGLPPGEHGIIGYRMNMAGSVLNVLRWSAPGRDARVSSPPLETQTHASFLGHRPAIVTRAEFEQSGFTLAHLDGARFNGYRVTSTLVTEVNRLLRANEPFVYAYYDGIDKVAHEYGLADHYDAELRFVDAMVAEIAASLPAGAALVVTSDHGQVDVGANTIELPPEVLRHVELQSGEGRFRWLHARPGRAAELEETAGELYRDVGWVVGLEAVLDEQWFGPVVSEAARGRLGDVALVAREPIAWLAPDDTGPFQLVSRHGSLTSAEMFVPLLAYCR